MGILSDARILEKIYDKEIQVDPFIPDHIQPASIDLTLSNKVKKLKNKKNEQVIHTFDKQNENYETIQINDYELKPGELILGSIRETITLPSNVCGRIENRSSLARCGINVSIGSYINPGYSGILTIMIKNENNVPVQIHKGIRICQLVFSDVEPASSVDYSKKKDAKYQKELGSEVSKAYQDKEIQEFLKKANLDTGLGEFLEKRLEKSALSIDEILTDRQKEKLGLK